MALKDTLKAVLAEMIQMGAITDPELRIGPNVKGLRVTPPAIWFIPKNGKGGGPDPAATRAQQQALGNVPRALHTRYLSIEVHLWAGGPASADDYSPGELLLNQFLAALHHQAYGVYRFEGEVWAGDGTDAMTLGRRVIARIEMHLPVIDLPTVTPAPTPTVVLTRATQTDQMNNTTSEQVG